MCMLHVHVSRCITFTLHVHMHVHVQCIKVYYSTCTVYQRACTCMCTSEFLISLEAWSKLAQQWLVCAPLAIHFEPINKELNAVSDNIIIINCTIWPKERTVLCRSLSQ